MSFQWSAVEIPQEGWTKNIRSVLHMSLRQLGVRIGITPQSVKEIEQREAAGSVSLNTMRGIAAAFGMRFVYAIVPEAGTVEDIIHERGRKLAEKIVLRARDASHPDATAEEEELVEELAKKLVAKMPRYFWD